MVRKKEFNSLQLKYISALENNLKESNILIKINDLYLNALEELKKAKEKNKNYKKEIMKLKRKISKKGNTK